MDGVGHGFLLMMTEEARGPLIWISVFSGDFYAKLRIL